MKTSFWTELRILGRLAADRHCWSSGKVFLGAIARTYRRIFFEFHLLVPLIENSTVSGSTARINLDMKAERGGMRDLYSILSLLIFLSVSFRCCGRDTIFVTEKVRECHTFTFYHPPYKTKTGIFCILHAESSESKSYSFVHSEIPIRLRVFFCLARGLDDR